MESLFICTGCANVLRSLETPPPSCCPDRGYVPLSDYLENSRYIFKDKPGVLHNIGMKYKTDKAYAHNYLGFYEKWLQPRDAKINILEIGVKDGASLKMWREYYANAQVYGIDITTPIMIPGCTVLQADQSDISALSKLPWFDLIIDDGSHRTKDQITSFEYLFNNRLKNAGLYVLEDAHTSSYPSYINSDMTAVQYLKMNYDKSIIAEFSNTPDRSDSYTIILSNA